MLFNASIALTWILFLALFPMSFLWLRRAWRILVKKDYSEVALKRGESPKNPRKYAPMAAFINLSAGSVAVCTILGVVVVGLPYDTWSAMAGVTIWMKIFADFILRLQAHPFGFKKKGWLRKRAA